MKVPDQAVIMHCEAEPIGTGTRSATVIPSTHPQILLFLTEGKDGFEVIHIGCRIDGQACIYI